MTYQLNPQYPILGGKGAETVRAYYYNHLGASSDTKLTGEKITRLLGLPQIPEIVNRADQWLRGLSDYDVLTTLDLLYIEQRLACWGSPQQYGNNWNIFQAFPFCHTRLYELLLSLPPDYRIKRRLVTDLIKTQWPELLKFPINNYRGIRGLRKNIRELTLVKNFKRVSGILRKHL